MKIATYNLGFLMEEGTCIHSGKEWNYSKEFVEERIKYFSEIFKKVDADIFLLQEVGSKSVIERIIERSGIDYTYFLAEQDPVNKVGNVVLYKQKDAVCGSIPTVGSMPVFVEGEKDVIGSSLWSRRDFVHVKMPWQGKDIHILGAHIKSHFSMPVKNVLGEAVPMITQIENADGLIRSEMFRLSQAKKLREVIDSILNINPEAFIVVGGDFNADKFDTLFRIIRGVKSKAPDALVEATSKIDPKDRFSLLSESMGPRLVDHILLSKSLARYLQDVQILNKDISTGENVAPFPTVVGSDHAPVVIELNI